ncbi:MAG TPA: aminotransferase class V-fold PLP-dependent enzyme [Vicinamibacterales bacterium]|nr:aminotransferase class V-fold PLP-dependent enzyme [Vicinamibacterales bacterium]
MSGSGWSRRDFGRLLALSGSAALLPRPARASVWPPQGSGEAFWASVRDEFLLAPGLAMFNAANLCPSSRRVVDALETSSREIDRDPSPANRRQLGVGREAARRAVAGFLGAAPEDVVLTRNTSESNNFVSSGLDLGPGDVVLVFSDNHPSNLRAWTDKAARRGFTVTVLPQPSPHPGDEAIVNQVRRAMSPATRLLAFSHVTATVGDLLPAAALCRLARERGVLTLVDGAQSFGVLDIDVRTMQPDFYSGSAHKWPCGARENGVLYVNPTVQGRIKPSVISLYGGAVGISRALEANGQRDEAAMIAFGEAVRMQTSIGKARIEARARQLTTALVDGLHRIPGVTVWTSPVADRRAAIVSFQPGQADPGRLAAALYEQDRIVCATRGGSDRPGLRFSPHFYNTMADVERTLAAVARRV